MITAPVQRLPVPEGVRALSTLSRLDYADTFVVDVGDTGRMRAEEWARAVLEDAPQRPRLLAGWSALGFKLDVGDPETVLGWEVVHSTPDMVLLGTSSRFGLAGQLFFRREPDVLRFATFVRHEGRAARLAWAGIERVHDSVVRSLLADASERLRQ